MFILAFTLKNIFVIMCVKLSCTHFWWQAHFHPLKGGETTNMENGWEATDWQSSGGKFLAWVFNWNFNVEWSRVVFLVHVTKYGYILCKTLQVFILQHTILIEFLSYIFMLLDNMYLFFFFHCMV